MQKTHVVFGQSIQAAMQLLALPDPVVALADDLSSGPLGDMLSQETGEDRVQWWTQVLAPPDPRYLERLKRSWHQFRTWLQSRSADDAVVIWAAENPAEMTGYLGVIAYLPATAPVSVINVNQAYARVYNTADVQYFIKYTGEIVLDKLAALQDHAIPLSQSARADAIARWHRLVDSRGYLRHITNGHVETVGVDYWDPFIIEQAHGLLRRQQPLSAVRLVGECLGRHPQIMNDALIFWRIRCLIESGTFTVNGSLDSMRNCSIWLPSESL
jgi:hypothetical protein